ncbi:MAG: hypothetical protein Q8P51_15850, partial [Ignavibacteria bacterium]|nr:hypothetical protein [Ignavibacteria bacterium]
MRKKTTLNGHNHKEPISPFRDADDKSCHPRIGNFGAGKTLSQRLKRLWRRRRKAPQKLKEFKSFPSWLGA